jgi:hypothetical protein
VSQSAAARGFRQFVFWGTYVLGSLCLGFSWLLAQVPRPLGRPDLRLDYVVRSGAAFLLLICVLSAKRLWYVRNPVLDTLNGPGAVTKAVLGAAWFELALSLCWIVILAIFR